MTTVKEAPSAATAATTTAAPASVDASAATAPPHLAGYGSAPPPPGGGAAEGATTGAADSSPPGSPDQGESGGTISAAPTPAEVAAAPTPQPPPTDLGFGPYGPPPPSMLAGYPHHHPHHHPGGIPPPPPPGYLPYPHHHHPHHMLHPSMVGMVPPPQGAPGDGKLDGMGGATMTSTSGGGNNKTGRWSLDEKILFLYGLRKFGKGRWKKIGAYIPHRTLVQIKSHAQKVLKRQEDGENIFRRLDDYTERVKELVAEAHERMGGEPPSLASPSTAGWRKRAAHQDPSEYKSATAKRSSSASSPGIPSSPMLVAVTPKIMVEASIQTDPYDFSSLDDPLGGGQPGGGTFLGGGHNSNNTIQLSVENSAGEAVIAQVPATLPPLGSSAVGVVADPLPPATVDDMVVPAVTMTTGGGGGAVATTSATNKNGGAQDEAAASALTALNK